jgi:ABC-type molybdate transport system substrate-binding protein
MRTLVLLLLLLAPLQARAQAVTVFAAASLTNAMKDSAALWIKAGHEAPRMSFASSSTLARHIEQGAPDSVFASAELQWMDYLAKRNLVADGTRKDLLGNDLVLVVERGECPAGIVYATDAAASKAVAVAGVFPGNSHDPITYPFAVTKPGDTPEARASLAFLSTPDVRAIWTRHGFTVE